MCSLAATQLKLAPAEALAAVTVNAAHVLGCAHDRGRHRRRATAPTSCCSTRPTGATSPTTSPGDIVATVVKDGRGRRIGANEANRSSTLRPMATRKQRRRREKSFRHEYEFVDRDEEGNETPVERVARERAEKKQVKPGRNGAEAAGQGKTQPPAPRGAGADLAARR